MGGLLALGACLATLGFESGAVVAMALAMEAENATFGEGDDVHIGLTYMTGTWLRISSLQRPNIKKGLKPSKVTSRLLNIVLAYYRAERCLLTLWPFFNYGLPLLI